MIDGEKIALRPVAFTDAPILMKWENDEANWEVSERESAYTFSEIIQLIDSSKDLNDAQQQRFMVLKKENMLAIGTLDLFDWRQEEQTIAIGILIQEQVNRNKGFALEALLLVETFLRKYRIKKIDCTIQASNLASIRLFEKAGYEVRSDLSDGKELKMQKWLKK